MEVQEISALIATGLPGCSVQVDGDGRHFSAVVVSEAFAGKSMVQQHQLVYKTLGDRMGGEIHALSIRTYTPEQWQQQQDTQVIK